MMEAKKKTPTLNEFNKLKSQQKYLEATQKLLDFGKKYGDSSSDQHLTTELNNIKDQLMSETDTFKNQKFTDVEELVSIIRHFKNTMLNKEGLQQFDTKQYRDQVIYIDQKFREMLHLNKVCLTVLKRQYAEIEARILPADVFLREIKDNNSAFASIHRTSIMRQVATKPAERDDNADVKKFLDYLVANNGHTGGWMEEEHNLFLKLKRKYGDNSEQIFMSFRHIVPGLSDYNYKLSFLFIWIFFNLGKTDDDLLKHEQWYTKYVDLKQRQKAAIQNWKCNQCNKKFDK